MSNPAFAVSIDDAIQRVVDQFSEPTQDLRNRGLDGMTVHGATIRALSDKLAEDIEPAITHYTVNIKQWEVEAERGGFTNDPQTKKMIADERKKLARAEKEKARIQKKIGSGKELPYNFIAGEEFLSEIKNKQIRNVEISVELDKGQTWKDLWQFHAREVERLVAERQAVRKARLTNAEAWEKAEGDIDASADGGAPDISALYRVAVREYISRPESQGSVKWPMKYSHANSRDEIDLEAVFFWNNRAKIKAEVKALIMAQPESGSALSIDERKRLRDGLQKQIDDAGYREEYCARRHFEEADEDIIRRPQADPKCVFMIEVWTGPGSSRPMMDRVAKASITLP